MKAFTVTPFSWLLCGLLAAGAEWAPPHKKLIHAGYPNSAKYLRENIRVMETLPFDGTIVWVPESNLGFDTRTKWSESDLKDRFDDLSHIAWGRFTDNFLMIKPADVDTGMDWFDDKQWENILHNTKLLANMAVTGRCVGICFDPEQYNSHIWNYTESHRHDTENFAETEKQVRKRGVQYIQAIQSVLPDVRILNYFAWSRFEKYIGNSERAPLPLNDLEYDKYGLYCAFLIGMLEAAGPNVTFIDGNEVSYYYTNRTQFDQAYVEISQKYLVLVPPELRRKYQQQVGVGVAVYVNHAFGTLSGSRTIGRFLSPMDRLRLFEHNVYYALDTTDEYAWCYSESTQGSWLGREFPKGAREAVVSASDKLRKGLPLEIGSAPFAAARVRQENFEKDSIRNIKPLTAVIHKTPNAPVIDGILNDPAWRQAERLGPFTSRIAAMIEKLEAQTTAQVSWDDQNLYVAYRCEEPMMQALHPTGKRDVDVWKGDSVEFFISPGSDHGPYFQFILNPGNVQADAIRDANGTFTIDWSIDWKSATRLGPNYWTAELAIPWRAIGDTPALGDTRRANLTRTRSPSRRTPPENEMTTWTPMWFLWNDTEHWGTFIFR